MILQITKFKVNSYIISANNNGTFVLTYRYRKWANTVVNNGGRGAFLINRYNHKLIR